MTDTANSRQVGGTHYRAPLQHWDIAALCQFDPFQYQVSKHLMRWRGKLGLLDLEKCQHYVQKYLELVRAGLYHPGDGFNQPAPRAAWLALLGVPDDGKQVPAGDVPQWVVAMDVRNELSVLTGCSSPDGHAELDMVRTWKELADAAKKLGYDSDLDTMAVPDGMMLVPRGSVASWRGFEFEGSKVNEDWYRCGKCREHFNVPTDDPPTTHVCPQYGPHNPVPEAG
jgi:hypothetical protein